MVIVNDELKMKPNLERNKNMKTKITAVYCRISTKQQKLDSQEDELNRWLENHQSAQVKWYRDKFTGTTMDRPSMERLLTDLRNSKLKEIVIYRLDRLGRTASGLTKLFEELQRYKCNLISLTDHLDLSTPSGRLNANIIASVAAYETEIRRERVSSGQAAAKARGVKWGGSQKGRLNKFTIEQVRMIVKMKKEGERVATICRSMGVNRPAVYRILERVESGHIQI